jgi:hypothetical protein
MTLAADLKEVIEEIGTSVTIIRAAGDITGEYIYTKINKQVTKPFIREFFLEAWIASDSQAVAGDVLELSDGRRFIIMNKTPSMFEDAIYRYDSVLYKCNVLATLQRPTDTRTNYTINTTFATIDSAVNALITESLYGNELDTDEELALLGLTSEDCYVPSTVGVEYLDRFWISATEYYQVEVVKKRRYENVDLIILGEDTR